MEGAMYEIDKFQLEFQNMVGLRALSHMSRVRMSKA